MSPKFCLRLGRSAVETNKSISFLSNLITEHHRILSSTATSRTFLVSAYHVESLFFSSSCVTRNLITKDFCNPVYCTHLESTHYYYRDLLSLVHFGLATVFAGCSCLGWMAAEVLPISLAENQNQASLNTY